MLESLIFKLCEDFPFNYQEKDAKGYYGMQIGAIQIALLSLDPGVHLKANLGEVPGGNQEELFSYLMRANYLSQGTGQSVIGVDETGKQFALLLYYEHDLNFRVFKLLIEDFVNYIEYWKEQIAKGVATKGAGR